MPLSIPTSNVNVVLIASTVSAAVSDEIELNPFYTYTIMCSPLSGGASITFDIYDLTTDSFVPMMSGGELVRMIKNYELLTIKDTAAVIKINKSNTSQPCGVTLMYR